MSTFTGSASCYSYMVPMWKLAHRNNQKPKVVRRRKSDKNAVHFVMMG